MNIAPMQNININTRRTTTILRPCSKFVTILSYDIKYKPITEAIIPAAGIQSMYLILFNIHFHHENIPITRPVML